MEDLLPPYPLMLGDSTPPFDPDIDSIEDADAEIGRDNGAVCDSDVRAGSGSGVAPPGGTRSRFTSTSGSSGGGGGGPAASES